MASPNIPIPGASKSPSHSHQGSPSVRQIPLPPASGSGTPQRHVSLSTSFQSGFADRSLSIDQVSEAEKARIVRRHLAGVKGDQEAVEAEANDFPVFDEERSATPTSGSKDPGDNPETYHKLLGGDVTHDRMLYAFALHSTHS
jgi:hypothetical protein